MYDLRVKDITFSIEENTIKCTIGRIDNMSSRTFDYVKIELLLKRGKKEELKISGNYSPQKIFKKSTLPTV